MTYIYLFLIKILEKSTECDFSKTFSPLQMALNVTIVQIIAGGSVSDGFFLMVMA